MFAFQPTAAPGTEASPGAHAQPTPGTAPAEGPPPGTAPQSPIGGGSGLMTFLLMVLPILLLFVTMGRSSKKQKQMEANLKTGDTVVTQSGLIGKITEMGEARIKLEIAPGVTVRMLKSSVSGVDTGDAAKTGDAKDKT
jgi:preprotein translocase subunit YajC